MPSFTGDVWFFDVYAPELTPCVQGSNYITIGTVPAGQYLLMFSGNASWQDQEGESVIRSIAPALDVDGFDAQGNEPEGWNGSGIVVRFDDQYWTIPSVRRARGFSSQSVVIIPGGTTLKLQCCDQAQQPQPTPISVSARLVALRVDPQNGTYGNP